MIPDFEQNGLLPKGIHLATLQEFEARFVYNYKRKAIYIGLSKLIQDLKSIGCHALYIDGSYVTNKQIPKDVDVCWEVVPDPAFLSYAKINCPVLFMMKAPRDEQQKVYCADVFPANLPADQSGTNYLHFFQQQKYTKIPKGIIKLEI